MEGPRPDPADERLLDLVQHCIDAFEAGGMSAVDVLLARHPADAPMARSRIEALLASGLLEPPRPADLVVPERLGEFRLLEKIGGGGMGVVYLAEQEGMGRRVALKLIRPEHLFFPGARLRFRREVEAVARLSHPGIVQVFTVGEAGDLPYFAMEHVVGASLSDVLRRLAPHNPARLRGKDLLEAVAEAASRAPDPRSEDAARLMRANWSDACSLVVRRVAEALQHAHERGVLHRDVKPSNVMLTPDGRVLLLDFGLASASGSAQITQTGSQMGSLAYMSPEQLQGGHDLDARSDVYSLGVTFYELLTLASPFHSDTTAGAIQQILDGRPTPLRDRNPAVSRDAETVCLAAIAREPKSRYASAADFARDLTNAIERAPILARRPSALANAVSWAKRHKGGAAAIALGIVAFGIAPGIIAWREHGARERISKLLASEKESRLRAEANFDRARRVVNLVQERFGDPHLLDIPLVDDIARNVLTDVLPLFQDFLAERGDDASLRAEAAEAARRVGEIEHRLGHYAEADRAIDRALELADLMATSYLPGQRELASRLRYRALVVRVEIDWALGRSDALERNATEAIALADTILTTSPDETGVAAQRAGMWSTRGAVRSTIGKFDDAIHDIDAALAWFESRCADDRGSLEEIEGLAGAANNRAYIARDLDDVVLAEAMFRKSLAMRARYRAVAPASTENAVSDANTRGGLATLLFDVGRREESFTEQKATIATLESLVERFPLRRDWQRMLATNYVSAARRADSLGLNDETIRSATLALDVLAELTALDPMVPDYFGSLAIAEMNLGAGYIKKRQLDLNRQALRRSLIANEKALSIEPNQVEWNENHRDILYRLGLAEISVYDYEIGAALAERLASDDDSDAGLRRRAAGLYGRCAQFAAKSPRLDPESRARRSREYTDRSLALLCDAVVLGFQDSAALLRDGDLEFVRLDPRFAQVVAEIDAPGPKGG